MQKITPLELEAEGTNSGPVSRQLYELFETTDQNLKPVTTRYLNREHIDTAGNPSPPDEQPKATSCQVVGNNYSKQTAVSASIRDTLDEFTNAIQTCP